eukprot:Skav234798  [mRNA]  locus=scaffold69:184976:194300:+ [translate_table: standard]
MLLGQAAWWAPYLAGYRGMGEAHGVMGFVKQGLVAEVTRASISRAIKRLSCQGPFFMQPIAPASVVQLTESPNFFTQTTCAAMARNIKLAAQLDKEGRFNGSAARKQTWERGVRQCLWTGGFFLTLDLYKGWDVLSGFAAGATGTAMNCWTDVCRSIVQKKALADTFDPSIPRPGAFEPYNPAPFFKEAATLASTKGIGGLYAGVGPKMVHLGGSGAILAVLMPRFKTMWWAAAGGVGAGQSKWLEVCGNVDMHTT